MKVVGHDWGGIVAWAFAGLHPVLLDRLVILNAPHLGIYSRNVFRSRHFLNPRRSRNLAAPFHAPFLRGR